MVVIPTGIISLPLSFLRNNIINSDTFQTWVGVVTPPAARAHVYNVDLGTLAADPDATIVSAMPFIIVDWADNFARVATAGGSRTQFSQEGELAMLFRAAIDPDDLDSVSDAAYAFLNPGGGIITDIESLAGVEGYLDIVSIRKEFGPHRPEEDESSSVGHYYEMSFLVEFEGL